MTSADAAPSEVEFLPLPADAKAVRFWDHWHDRIAVFETTEDLFRGIFPSVRFEEIQQSRSFPVAGFGDSSTPPWKQTPVKSREVTDGIIFEKIERNGGGETIIYDRRTGTGYYCYAGW